MFKTHQVGDKLYFEIPNRELNTDMLIVGRYARAAAGRQGVYGGDRFDERTVRWERNGNRIVLRSTSFSVVADTSLPIHKAVMASNYAPIVAVFKIEAYGPDNAAVIDVTRLYTTSVPEFAGIRGQIDEKRSYIESASAFPDNVEIEATQTGIPAQAGGAASRPSGSSTAESILAHWSMVRLPRNPMIPRLADERVGYFDIERTDFGTNEQRAARRAYIARWRLEKKDPNAAVSDPIKPLVYYVDPATPEPWKPWIRKAILDWQPAFEAAGFSNAIIAADPPTDDPRWSPDDVRHTVVRWLPSKTENAEGPHISDPRTGEILNGSIRMFHNILNLQRDWYFTQVGPLDARAQKWPMPDSLMGRLLEFVVAHEIGHTLGLRHNHLGSSTYPADSLRSPTWMHTMGSSPSIMDYSRYNYVAQPEDHIALDDLIPRVGPYDKFAIHWGYAPIPGARTAKDERVTLDRWAMMQDTIPWYRFAEWNSAGGYGTLYEAVGDADPVWSTGWGIKNLQRVIKLIPDAAIQPGHDNSDLKEIYDRTIGQWTMEMEHVLTIVGGAMIQLKSGSQPGAVYTPLPRARQQKAVRFINEQAFKTPMWLVDESIIRRIESTGMLSRIFDEQAQILIDLFATERLLRLVDYEALALSKTEAYTLRDMLDDVRHGIWEELSTRRVIIDVYRRTLQRAYLDQIDKKLNQPASPLGKVGDPIGASADIVAALRGELVALDRDVRVAIPRAGDTESRQHLQAVEYRIAKILDPRS